MGIKEFRVKRLFGIFDHRIPLRKRITIIHGPNGYGKTAILKMLSSVISGQRLWIARIPFETFSVLLEDGRTVVAQRSQRSPGKVSHSKSEGPDLNISLSLESGTPNTSGVHTQPLSWPQTTDVPSDILDIVDRRIPGPFRRYQNGWVNEVEGTYYDIHLLSERFPTVFQEPELRELLARFISPKKSSTASATPVTGIFDAMAVHFIHTRRLDVEHAAAESSRRYSPNYMRDDEIQKLRVTEYSQDIVQRIRVVLGQYAKYSQQLDSTFPERLVDFIRQHHAPMADKEILESLERLEKKRADLTRIGFLDKEGGLRDLASEDIHRIREALHIYVSDVDDKLRVFDDLARRVSLFVDILNGHFAYKTLSISRERGFVVMPTGIENMIRPAPLALEELSSGEQNELVLLYELLFRVPPKSLVLIDEPEISLHVEWQIRFLDDLEKVLIAIDSIAIVATHSPQIINNRWNDTIQLTGPTRKA